MRRTSIERRQPSLIRRTSLIAAVILFLAAAWIAAASLRKELIFKVNDPYGDDHGDGSLVYPLRSDLEPGELDILELSALKQGDDTVFRVVFAKEIRPPGRESIDGLGTPREAQARLGFYTFNLDLYIDTDRQPGSGQVAMLPGRKAEVAPPFAYEKAIAVTPRPEALRASIKRLRIREWKAEEEEKRTVSASEVRRRKKQIAEELMPLIYFPTRLRVMSRQIDIFVPNGFLGGAADPTWAYALAVTGARLDQRFNLPFFGKYAQESSHGLVLPVVPGRDREAFGGGREGEELQPPLIDILVPPGAAFSQQEILKNYDSYQEQRVQIPGIVPADL